MTDFNQNFTKYSLNFEDSIIRKKCAFSPELRVTGMTGAVGQTTLTWLGRISARLEAHPWPVSPRPCMKIKVAVCLLLAGTVAGEDASELISSN